MLRSSVSIVAASAVLLAGQALADVPTQWTLRVIARDSSSGQALGVPADTIFSQSGVFNQPAVDADGSCGIRYTTLASTPNKFDAYYIFSAATNSGASVLSPTTFGYYAAGLDMNNGRVAIPVSGLIAGGEVRLLDGSLDRPIPVGGPLSMFGGIAGLRILADGAVAYRCNASNGAGGQTVKLMIDRGAGAERTQTELASSASGVYSLIGVPAANDNSQMLARATVGGVKTIVRFSADSAPTDVLRLADFAAYNDLAEPVGFNNSGQAAFFLRRAADSQWELRRSTQGVGVTIAASAFAAGQFDNTLTNSSPRINGEGLVAFKAARIVTTSPYATSPGLWVGDGTSLVRVAGDGTQITLPNGQTATLGFGSTANRTAIVGEIAFTGRHIAFLGRLSDGSVALIRASAPAARCTVADVASLGGAPTPDNQLTADDVVYYLSAFFAGNTATADIARLGGQSGADGQITVDDLVYFLQQFFAGCPQ